MAAIQSAWSRLCPRLGHQRLGSARFISPPPVLPRANHAVQQRRLQPQGVQRLTTSTRLHTSSTAVPDSNGSKSHTGSPKTGRPPQSRKAGVVAAIIVVGAAGWAWLFLDSGSGGSGGVYPTKFTPFTVISREQISPTAFIITIRNDQPHDATINPASVKDAWQHGLWSVEIKQPQLQIARHYTPLPPSGDHEETNELSFLVRKMDTGEMSNYLSRRQVGEQIFLRGPHLGFDVSKRLGASQKVVFLAGGTGIAPALQLAEKLLGAQAVGTPREYLPTISILWANRQGIDALGRQASDTKSTSSSSSWTSWLWPTGTTNTSSKIAITSSSAADSSTVSAQITRMRQNFGPNFHIRYFVDDEKTFITQDDIKTALAQFPASSSYSSNTKNSEATEARCIWHSPSLLERMAGDNDADRSKDVNQPPCPCGPGSGKNLFLVSGPDGFIRAYAGSKWWHSGMEMQGTVRGVVENLMRDGSLQRDDWLVLKL